MYSVGVEWMYLVNFVTIIVPVKLILGVEGNFIAQRHWQTSKINTTVTDPPKLCVF